MRVSRKGSQALALGAGVATLLAISAPHGWAKEAVAGQDLSVTKTGATTATTGSLFSYTVTVTNVGTAVSDPNTLTDTLPVGLVPSSATIAVAPSAGGPCAIAGQTVTCIVPALGISPAPASSAVATISVFAATAGAYNNMASIAAVAPEAANANNTGSAATTVTGNAITCFGAAPTIVGTAGDDTLNGTSGNDVILGLGGNDTIDGLQGDDKICGGDGNDHLYGGSGADSLAGGNGSDLVDGGAGKDVVKGGSDQASTHSWSASHNGPNDWYHDGNRNRDHGRDVLICERQDTCGEGFDQFHNLSTDAAGRHYRGRGDGNDRIIWVPLQDGRGRHGGHGNHGDGWDHNFSADKKSAPVKPGMKPGMKPVKPAVQPAAKPLAKPALADAKPVAPKA